MKNIVKTLGLLIAMVVTGCNTSPTEIRKEYYMLGDFDRYNGVIIREIERDYSTRIDRETRREYKELSRTVSLDETRQLEGLGRKVYFCDGHHLPD